MQRPAGAWSCWTARCGAQSGRQSWRRRSRRAGSSNDVATRWAGTRWFSRFCVLCSVGLRGAQRPSALSPSGFCVLGSVFSKQNTSCVLWFCGFWVLWVLWVLVVLTPSRVEGTPLRVPCSVLWVQGFGFSLPLTWTGRPFGSCVLCSGGSGFWVLGGLGVLCSGPPSGRSAWSLIGRQLAHSSRWRDTGFNGSKRGSLSVHSTPQETIHLKNKEKRKDHARNDCHLLC